jgi:hypothetical protein
VRSVNQKLSKNKVKVWSVNTARHMNGLDRAQYYIMQCLRYVIQIQKKNSIYSGRYRWDKQMIIDDRYWVVKHGPGLAAS